ncbi:MAG: DUF4299 family protein [Fusobacteriaceae bacterium]|nr:DUF4299 family protein [Fusobacteriaceae bacterium]
MALTLQIRDKNLFKKNKIDINKIIEVCNFNYGSWNDFYILNEGESKENTLVAYNLDSIGRGIFINYQKINKSIIEIQINLPTSEKEINDFYNIVKELNTQLKNIEIYFVEENKRYKYNEFLEQKETVIEFSLNTLKKQCEESKDEYIIYTAAMWPLTISNKEKEFFLNSSPLKEFEIFLNSKQNIDCYYSKPTIYKNQINDKYIANYTLTDECLSIFPIDGKFFLNFNLLNLNIDEFTIQFFIFSEKKVIDGFYDYKKFIAEIMKNDFQYFDSTHIIIPPLSKNYLLSILDKIEK